MNYWIFQGNPRQFNVSKYVSENEVVSWGIRQKHFQDKVSIGDQVFIWRSDGGERNTGGIIATAEISSEIYNEDENLKVDLNIKDYRLTTEKGMLMRHDLKEIPETMNQRILKVASGTNFILEKGEYERILALWKNPELVKKRLDLSLLEKYLYLFKWDAEEELSHMDYMKESQTFFEQFKERTHLETMEWEDIQQLGNHINALSMPLAKKRALGKMNAPLERYRDTFIYLIHGEASVTERIDRFLTDEKYKLFGLGASVVSELLGNVFPEDFCFYNQRDKVAVENVLNIDPDYARGDSYGDKFMKFQHAIKQENIIAMYEKVVGKLTDLPIFLEVDQFFSFLYENFSKSGEEIIEVAEQPKYWGLSAGENNFMWNDFRENNQIAIGWKELGDLREYNSKTEIMDALKEIHQSKGKPSNDALANYQFCYEMQIGDYVFIKHGTQRIVGYGKIIGEYKYDETSEKYRSRRDVEWIKIGNWRYEGLPLKTLTDWTVYGEFVEKIIHVITEEPGNDYIAEEPSNMVVKENTYGSEHFLHEVFMSEKQAMEMIESLDYKKNVILQGPPGVGKTFVAKRLAYLHMGMKDPEKIEMVQFHQSYSYEDFIRGYKPEKEGFALKDGTFYRFCQKAIENPESNYYMVIDEINRGNLSKIFGELMLLLESDKRGKEFAVKLAYTEKEETFYIPKNIYLIGTMNTADRSLALVDYALRRRFIFLSLDPAFGTDKFEEFLRNKSISQGLINRITTTIKEINDEITGDIIHLGKGFEIGHSYFCPTVESVLDEEKWFARIIRLEIAPLLHEYWFDREEKVNELLNKFD